MMCPHSHELSEGFQKKLSEAIASLSQCCSDSVPEDHRAVLSDLSERPSVWSCFQCYLQEEILILEYCALLIARRARLLEDYVCGMPALDSAQLGRLIAHFMLLRNQRRPIEVQLALHERLRNHQRLTNLLDEVALMDYSPVFSVWSGHDRSSRANTTPLPLLFRAIARAVDDCADLDLACAEAKLLSAVCTRSTINAVKRRLNVLSRDYFEPHMCVNGLLYTSLLPSVKGRVMSAVHNSDATGWGVWRALNVLTGSSGLRSLAVFAQLVELSPYRNRTAETAYGRLFPYNFFSLPLSFAPRSTFFLSSLADLSCTGLHALHLQARCNLVNVLLGAAEFIGENWNQRVCKAVLRVCFELYFARERVLPAAYQISVVTLINSFSPMFIDAPQTFLRQVYWVMQRAVSRKGLRSRRLSEAQFLQAIHYGLVSIQRRKKRTAAFLQAARKYREYKRVFSTDGYSPLFV